MTDAGRRRAPAGTASPWAVITILGCALLVSIDYWRGQGPTAWPVLRGSLPNLIAVPTLAFGALMLRFPQRTPYSTARAALQDRWFRRSWLVALAVTIAWEFSQHLGALVFDPLDLAATGIGAAAAPLLYRQLRSAAFLAPRQRDRAQ